VFVTVGKQRKLLIDSIKYVRLSYHPAMNAILATGSTK
jgi:hypothetical protein